MIPKDLDLLYPQKGVKTFLFTEIILISLVVLILLVGGFLLIARLTNIWPFYKNDDPPSPPRHEIHHNQRVGPF